MREVLEFLGSLVVELEELLDEISISSREGLSVLLKVEDSASLALDLVDVYVILPSNFVACARALSGLTGAALLLLLLSNPLLFLDVSEFRLNAELIVATLLLPESLELLTLSLGESERSGLDGQSSLLTCELIELG